MVEADDAGTLVTTASDRLVLSGERISLREMARQAEMTVDDAQEAWRAVGLGAVDPDEPYFVEDDVDTFVNFRAAVEVFGKESILQFTRLAGSVMARLAESGRASFMSDIERPLTEAQASDLEVAQTMTAASVAAANVPIVLTTFYRHHWQATIHRFRAARAGVAGFDGVRLAVGFVDLVGFTPLAQALSTEELSRTIADFEARAFDVATSHDGRIIKHIGDEVMFTALDARGACQIALELFEMLGEHRSVTPRGGLAVGELLTRAGDYFGPIVNFASRIADLAVPDEILVSTEVREETIKATADYRFDPAGRRMLKGFDEPVDVFSLTRAG